MLKWVALGVLMVAIAGAVYVRMAEVDPARWHVDPATVTPGARPNDHLVAGEDAVFVPLSPQEALRRVDAIARSEPRVRMIEGGVEAGHATWVQRSASIGFPDYISVRAQAVEGGSRVSVYSRSRFGHSDFGVNEARVARWLARLEKDAITAK